MNALKDLKGTIARLADGETLDADAATAAFEVIMSGEATPSQIGGFLMALRVRGETIDEITGGARVLRAKMVPVKAPAGAIDIVGTGGDGSGTYNISTASAFVVAGAGVPVAKHGNRALSSRSGAADSLSALGINIELDPPAIARCIKKAGVGFMMAPRHHSAMRHVGPTRVELGTRTIFNLLGPLCNPASVKHIMMGVFAPGWVEPLARVLANLGVKRAWVVHGDGLDEVTTTGETKVASLANGNIETFTITPEMVGLPRAKLADLVGGTPEHNAEALRALLEGRTGRYRDIVLMNSAAALVVAGRVDDLKAGVEMATHSVDSGKALAALETLARLSHNGRGGDG